VHISGLWLGSYPRALMEFARLLLITLAAYDGLCVVKVLQALV